MKGVFIMKKLNEWLDEPITWRKSFRFAGIVTIVETIVIALVYSDECLLVFENIKEKIGNFINKKKSEKE
jgi:hypothetical protein